MNEAKRAGQAKKTSQYRTVKKKTRREITDTDRAFYRLGQLDAEEYIQKTMIILRHSNEQQKSINALLINEIYDLDAKRPRTGVLISLKNAWKIIKALKKPSVNRELADKLEDMYEQVKLGQKPEFNENGDPTGRNGK